MENVTLAMLGRAKKLMIDKGYIVNGAGKKADMSGQVALIRRRSRIPRTTTVRSCRSVWPSSPAASR